MVDSSKWKDIEVSYDEDNCDSISLFRCQVKEEIKKIIEEKRKEETEIKKMQEDYDKEVKSLIAKMSKEDYQENEDFWQSFAELKVKGKQIKEEKKAFEERQKVKMMRCVSKSIRENLNKIFLGFNKSGFNKPDKKNSENLSKEEKLKKMMVFVNDEKEKLINEFAMLENYEDSRKFMMEHPELACLQTANYLLVLHVHFEYIYSGFGEMINNMIGAVAHQTICVQFILRLAKQLEIDPRTCIFEFFDRIQMGKPEYKKAFTNTLEPLKLAIHTRALEDKEKIEVEARKELEKKALETVNLASMLYLN